MILVNDVLRNEHIVRTLLRPKHAESLHSAALRVVRTPFSTYRTQVRVAAHCILSGVGEYHERLARAAAWVDVRSDPRRVPQ